MAVTSANRYLSQSEMEGNATYIWSFFNSKGWSINAVAAMLGNMQTESTINPGIYESLDDTSASNGFGLVQWTPNTKYKEWADANGYGGNYANIDGQLERIIYELKNGLQWITTSKYPMTFETFSTSNMPVETLAQIFLYNYERAADLNQPNRSTQARAWYNYLQGIEPGEITPVKHGSMSKLLLYFAGMKR